MQATTLFPSHHVLSYQSRGSGTTIWVQRDLARWPWLCTLQLPWGDHGSKVSEGVWSKLCYVNTESNLQIHPSHTIYRL